MLPKTSLMETEVPFMVTNPDGTSTEFIAEENTDKKGGSKIKRMARLPKRNGSGSSQNGRRSNPLSRSKSGTTPLRSGKDTKADGPTPPKGSRRKVADGQKVSGVSDKRVS